MESVYIITEILIDIDIVAAWKMAAICKIGSRLFPRIFAKCPKKIIMKSDSTYANTVYRKNFEYISWYSCPIYDAYVWNYLVLSAPLSQFEVTAIVTYKFIKDNINFLAQKCLNCLALDLFNKVTIATGGLHTLIKIRDSVDLHNSIFSDDDIAMDLIHAPLTSGNISYETLRYQNEFYYDACNVYWPKLIDMINGRISVRKIRLKTSYVHTEWNKYFAIYRSPPNKLAFMQPIWPLASWNIDSFTIIKHAIMFCRRRLSNKNGIVTMLIAAINHGHCDYIIALHAARHMIEDLWSVMK